MRQSRPTDEYSDEDPANGRHIALFSNKSKMTIN